MSSGDWMCAACQHLNFKKRESCQRCSCPKYATEVDVSAYGINRTEVLAGDWYCSALNCGSHNYASRTSCYRCGGSRDYCGYDTGMTAPASYAYDTSVLPGWKTGDWICTRLGCGVHNYASRTECFKCKTPKDFDGHHGEHKRYKDKMDTDSPNVDRTCHLIGEEHSEKVN